MSVGEVACPFCGSRDVDLVSAWGGQLLTSQLRCGHCNTYFEAVRDDFDAVAPRELRWPDLTSGPDTAT